MDALPKLATQILPRESTAASRGALSPAKAGRLGSAVSRMVGRRSGALVGSGCAAAGACAEGGAPGAGVSFLLQEATATATARRSAAALRDRAIESVIVL